MVDLTSTGRVELMSQSKRVLPFLLVVLSFHIGCRALRSPPRMNLSLVPFILISEDRSFANR